MHALFSTKGDIKGIYPAPEKNNQTVIDFFDTRACERAFDELNGKPMAGGSMDLRFAWDILVTDVIEAVPVGVAELAAPIAGVSIDLLDYLLIADIHL